MYIIKKYNAYTIIIFRIVNVFFRSISNFYNIVVAEISSSRFNECGDNNIFDKNIWINQAHNIRLKSNIFIGKDVFLNAYDRIEIGNFCAIGAGSKLITANHSTIDLSLPVEKRGLLKSPIILDDNVWLGYNVIILPGVKLGKGCVVAAGSVVTKSFDNYSMIGGVPAKLIKKCSN